jgi:putative membrane protein
LETFARHGVFIGPVNSSSYQTEKSMLERRVFLTAIAGMVATPAFAQTARNEQAGVSGAASNNIGPAEEKHMRDTMAAGSMSLLASRAALKKVRDDDVKQFAEFEVAEQETIADVLMTMKDSSKVSGKLNPPSDSEVRQHVPENDQATLQKMEQMDGKEFEEAYVRAQIEGHQKLLRIQEEYLSSGTDVAHINLAKLARGQIKEHLQLLADLNDDDDKSATTGRSSRTRK